MAPGYRWRERPNGMDRAPHRPSKRKREAEDIDFLQNEVDTFEAADETSDFVNLPLSKPTQSGLAACRFEKLTEIQAQSVPSALKGNDILGAARTGSGKTLAFLIPVLENLYRKRWTEYDGLGALILSPTRELAIQIFEVLRKIGRNHTFSAGLVIGGKSLQEERQRLGRMNILVATPGRMLQHMDQTSEFEVGNLQILVLDEADRIMDMGFKETVDAIIEHLPPAGQRQTLLFSATQTKRVSDLARLNLKGPEFVSANEAETTPDKLQQNYVVTPLADKLDTLWSFIRANLKAKTLVFLSSGKQVRFVFEAFRHLQPGIPLLHLHGRQKQTARLDITTRFSRSQTAVLFATDVAARGLDFPEVDWVVQVDCPEDVDTYIHRVGRTARYQRDGKAVLMLDPTEEVGMLQALAGKKIVIEKINVRQKKQSSIRSQLQNMCFKDPELKYLGQKSFISYVRSIYIQKNKDIFKVKELALDDFASSMGLPGTPRVKFVKGDDAKARKNQSRQLITSSDDDGQKTTEKQVRTKYDRMFERTNQDILADHYTKIIEQDPSKVQSHDDEDEFLSVKRRFGAGDAGLDQGEYGSSEEDDRDDSQSEQPGKSFDNHPQKQAKIANKRVQLSDKADDALVIDSKRREKLLKSKKALLKFKGHGSHMHFDEDGVGHEAEYYEREEEFKKKGDVAAQRERFLQEEKRWIAGIDEEDKQVARDKRREKKTRRKEKEKEIDSGRNVAVLDASAAGEDVGVDLDTLDFDDKDDDRDEHGLANNVGKDAKEKKAKKWFEDSSDDSSRPHKKTRRRKAIQAAANIEENDVVAPQTVEELEAMALGVMRRGS